MAAERRPTRPGVPRSPPPPRPWSAFVLPAVLLAAGVAALACAPDEAPPPATRGGTEPTAAVAPTAPAAPTGGGDEPPPLAEHRWPASELRAGGEVAGTLGPGAADHWRLPLAAGGFFRVTVEQDGVDVEVALLDPAGRTLLTADRNINDRGPELILAALSAGGVHTLAVRAFPGSGPGAYRARIDALRPATESDRLAAATYGRFRAAWELPPAEAAVITEEVLATWRRMGERELEAETLDRLGHLHLGLQDFPAAVAWYRQAAAAFAAAGDRRWEAICRNNLAIALQYQGDLDPAVAEYGRGQELARAVGDPVTAAKAAYGLAVIHYGASELQAALDGYRVALARFPPDDARRPHVLHALGVLQARRFGDLERGTELLTAARDAWQPGAEDAKARTLGQLAVLAFERGRFTAARSHLEAALALAPERDRCGRAGYSARLALVEQALGEEAETAARMASVVAAVGDDGCPEKRVGICLLAAAFDERRGRTDAARATYRRCSAAAADQGDLAGLAESLLGVARAERLLGRTAAALAASSRALEISESVRPTVLREDLRTGYFSTVQERYDLQIALLLETGRVGEAWVAAEQGRARALRDLLDEAGAGLRQAAAPELAERERSLRRALNTLETRRVASGGASERVRSEIARTITELEAVRGEIRRADPRRAEIAAFASLASEGPPDPARLRRELLDGDTLLLEFRLGEEESHLWAVDREGVAAYSLPARREIESMAAEAGEWLRSRQWPGSNPRPLCEASRTLLGPVAERLAGRRLVLVPDGALEALSFAALPDPAAPGPCTDAPPLVARHEIAYLPSALALAAQRERLGDRRPAEGWLAAIADPVYRADDPRLAPPAGEAARPGTRGGGAAVPRFARLPYSREEAAAILRLVPPERRLVALGLDAAKERVTGGDLSRYRILHFAVHGVLDGEHPLLSFLALSTRDVAGGARPGALYAHEIYDLDLPAELVVLSACDTGRGRQVAGEGVVAGLPRAFLYAGAARVLVSLWAVEDRSTAELMSVFYRGLLEGGMAPGRALAHAQRTMARAGRPPREWAGFVLQGDWRPLAPFGPRSAAVAPGAMHPPRAGRD